MADDQANRVGCIDLARQGNQAAGSVQMGFFSPTEGGVGQIDLVQLSATSYNPDSNKSKRFGQTVQRGYSSLAANRWRQESVHGIVHVVADRNGVRLDTVAGRCIIGISASTRTVRRTHGGVSIDMLASTGPSSRGCTQHDVDGKQPMIPPRSIRQEIEPSQALQHF